MLLENLSQAVTLFALGMGTVFVLLTLLISVVSLLSTICLKFESDSQSETANGALIPSDRKNISEMDRAIVFAAVQAHRQAKGL